MFAYIYIHIYIYIYTYTYTYTYTSTFDFQGTESKSDAAYNASNLNGETRKKTAKPGEVGKNSGLGPLLAVQSKLPYYLKSRAHSGRNNEESRAA